MKLLTSSVLIVLPHRQFNDHEFLTAQQALESEGCRIKYAAASLQPAIGEKGSVVRPQVLFSDINADLFDGILFVGGQGSRDFWAHPRAHNVVRDMESRGKVLAAICLAPVIFARAGILKGRTATCHPAARKELESAGATYLTQQVVDEGRIITASSPESSELFIQTVVQKLSTSA